MGNFDVDNFFTIFNKRGRHPFFPPSIGVEVGVFCWRGWKGEAGIDYLGGTDHPFFFNGKIGIDENKLFTNSPAFNVGIFDVGTSFSGRNRTNQNVFDIIIGKSLPKPFGGRIFAAGYFGTHALGRDRYGLMFGFLYPFFNCVDCCGKEYTKLLFAADYATGKNLIGGGGFALWYYFTPYSSIETGPVWFNDAHLNGQWKWSTQVNINFPIFRACCPQS